MSIQHQPVQIPFDRVTGAVTPVRQVLARARNNIQHARMSIIVFTIATFLTGCGKGVPEASDIAKMLERGYAKCEGSYKFSNIKKTNGYVDPRNENQYVIEYTSTVTLMYDLKDITTRVTDIACMQLLINAGQVHAESEFVKGLEWNMTSSVPMYYSENGWTAKFNQTTLNKLEYSL